MDEYNARFFHPEIPGWSDDILPYYEQIVQKIPNGSKILEMGVYDGRSALYMIEEIEKSKKDISFYCIDIAVCPHCLKGHDKLTFIQKSSEIAAKDFQDQSLDLVFIDGNHSYESVKLDISSWFPKVKFGGIIAGHDYTENGYEGFAAWMNCKYWFNPEPGVVRAVDEFFGKDKVGHPTRTVWEIIKQ